MRALLREASSALRFEPVGYRLRAWLDGAVVLDTRRAVLVWEPRRVVPAYAVPEEELRAALEPVSGQLRPPDPASLPPVIGPESFEPHTCAGQVVDVVHGPQRLDCAGFRLADPDLAGLVELDFHAFDGWRSEDEVLLAHPRDPFKRIDVLRSESVVEVSLDGMVLAATDRASVLLETPLPARYYIPPEDVFGGRLTPSETVSTCAYKGRAAYLSTADGRPEGRDIAWTYPAPLDDALRVRDHVAFWNERVDLRVDGVLQRRPVTPWSSPAEQAAEDPLG